MRIAAAQHAPAGGAATGELITMTIALTVAFGGLFAIGKRYRRAPTPRIPAATGAGA